MLHENSTSALPYLAFIVLLGVQTPAVGSVAMWSRLIQETEPESGDSDQGDWGSGYSFHPDLLIFPADSPFMTETPGKTKNCSHHFWLPMLLPVCLQSIAGPEEFAQSRLLVLQNRAALHAVSQSSGVEEGQASYEQQAIDDVQGVQADHLTVAETILATQKVFFELEEKRRDGKEHAALLRKKEHISTTNELIYSRKQGAAVLEKQFFNLERTLHFMQHRLDQLMEN